MSEFAIGCEQQQTRRTDIQAAYIDPTAMSRRRQSVEDLAAIAWIVPRGEFTGRFIVRQDAMTSAVGAGQFDLPAVEEDPLITVQLLSQCGLMAVDNDTALTDPTLDLPSRTNSGVGQRFLDALGQA